MKQKRKFEEYITRDELENTYNYQRKVFNSKIEEINQIIDKIQECFSVRFGEDLSNSRYDREIQELKYNLNQVQAKNISEINEIVKSLESIVDEKLNEFEFKNEQKLEEDRNHTKDIIKSDIEEFYQEINNREKSNLEQIQAKNISEINEIVKSLENIVDEKLNEFQFKNEKKIEEDRDFTKSIIKEDIERFYQDVNKRILDEEEFKNAKLKELNESIEYVEQRTRELNGSIEEYVKNFRDELKDIGKDGRSRTAIGKLQKTIQDIKDNKEEIEGLVNTKVDDINNAIEQIETNLKIDIDSKVEKLDYENTLEDLKENIRNIEELITVNKEENNRIVEELNEVIQNKLEELYYTKENIETNLNEMQNRIDIDIQENQIKLEQAEYYFQNQVKESIQDLNYEETIDRIQGVENCISQIKQANDEMQINNNDVTQQMQAVLSIVASLEDKLNKSGIDTLTEDVGKIIDRQIKFIQNKYEKLFEQKLKAFERNIKVHEQMLENKMLQGRIQTMKKTNTMPTQNYNVVTFKNNQSKPSNIYNKIQNTQIKQSAQSDIIYDEKQTYLQEAINKLKTQEEISRQIRNTTPKKNQILFDFDVEE